MSQHIKTLAVAWPSEVKSLRNAYFITTFFWRKCTNKSIYLKSLYSTRDFLCAPAAPFFSCHVLNSKINDYYSHQMTFLITLRIIFLPVLIIIIWGGRYLLAGSRTCSHLVSCGTGYAACWQTRCDISGHSLPPSFSLLVHRKQETRQKGSECFVEIACFLAYEVEWFVFRTVRFLLFFSNYSQILNPPEESFPPVVAI